MVRFLKNSNKKYDKIIDSNTLLKVLEFQLEKYKEISEEVKEFEILEILVNDYVFFEYGYEKTYIKVCLLEVQTQEIIDILKKTDDFANTLVQIENENVLGD